MKQADQIIHARWIIPCENNQLLENHALIISQGKIIDLLPSQNLDKNYTARVVEHFSSHALLPGLINTHTHIGMNMFRGLADDRSLMDWLNHHIWPAERSWLSHDLVYDASLLATAEMIRSGTTCFNEMYFFLPATAEAAEQAGLRGQIGITVLDFPTPWAQNLDEYLAKGLDFYEKYKNHERIGCTLAPHAIYTVAEKSLIKVRDFAERYHLKINMHVQETEDEIKQSLAETQKRPLRRLQELDLVNPNLIAIHLTQINEEDLDILQEGKPQLVHCPESNMKLASGTCPVMRFRARGLNVALGTDGVASNNDLDMLSEMRTATFLAKHSSHNPQALSAGETLQMATLNGAKALGLDQIIGTLQIGKAADFIAIQLDTIETQPLYHPCSQIVYCASRQEVSDVWVAGKRLLKNRELLTLDEKELRQRAKNWQHKIAALA